MKVQLNIRIKKSSEKRNIFIASSFSVIHSVFLLKIEVNFAKVKVC